MSNHNKTKQNTVSRNGSTEVLFLHSGGVLITGIMHGRSRMAVDPRIPTMPGRSTSVFAGQADIASTKREAP